MSKEIQINRIMLVLWGRHTVYSGKAKAMAEDLVSAGFGDRDRFELVSEPDPGYDGGVKFEYKIRPKKYEEER
jgi:hypothetical protein